MRRAITSAFTVLGSFLSSVPFDVHAQAAAVHAASCSAADTEMAMGATRDGDIVVIPSCPAGVSWPSTMTVTKGITIQGAGIGRTVLLDGVFKGNALCAGGGPMLRFLVASPKTWRLTGLTVRGSAPDTAVCQSGHVHVSHTTKAWRIDHVRIENQQTVGVRVTGDTWGLIDHAQFQGVHKNGVIVGHDAWGGHSYGDGSWSDPLSLGTERAIYVEDCTFSDAHPVGAGAVDALDGGRFVFRHNRATFLATHGTESSGRRRGVRSYEIYNNTFDAESLVAVYTAINVRGGTGVIYDNTFAGDYGAVINLQNFRDTAGYAPWGRCDGSSVYDQNQPGQRGYACLDQIGRSTGTRLSGDSPAPAAWPNQALEPLYQWGNVKNGVSNPTVASHSPHIRATRDYVDNVVRPGYTALPYPHPLAAAGPSSVPDGHER